MVWLHYHAALVHKIFGVSVNVIKNIMHIHCLLMIGCVLSSDFPLNLVIIGNVLGLRGLSLLYGRGDGIRTFPTERYRRAEQWRMGLSLSALLSPSLLHLNGMELEPSPQNAIH
jgi:hypothetical protein